MFASIAALSLIFTSLFTPFLGGQPHFVPRSRAVCSAPAGDVVACLSKVYAQADGKVSPAAGTAALPAGYGPAQLRKAYNIPTGAGGRVAVIGAYDNPNAKIDLDKYSATFNLPKLPNCSNSVQTSCFAKFDQRGGSFYPRRDRGWAFETALDIQTVHALCPTCRIDLIEATTASIANMMAAVDRAVILGATVVSMSWGADEFSSETAYSSHFAPAGVSFVSASGDWGYGASWPAASGRVIAAGGTTLKLNPDGTRATETAWSEGGSGCSAYELKPSRQHDTGCSRRTIADIAAVADPATGAAIYSSYSPYGTGWFQVGGTSLSAPIIASLIAQTGDTTQATVLNKLYSAAGTPHLFDITAGSNGSCPLEYLCQALPGYDGPTGLGSPNGLGAL